MESIMGPNKSNTLLLIAENSQPVSELLSDKYDFIYAANSTEALPVLEEHPDDIAAILIMSPLAAPDDYDFLKCVENDTRFSAIPVLLTTMDKPTEDDIKTFQYGITDFISLSVPKAITTNRIDNAIRLKDSKTYYEFERILKALPSNIYLKDSKCRYIFATHYWHHLEHGDDPNWTIRGKTDLEIRKDKENAAMAMEKDRELIATGVGSSYVIEINTDGVQEFFEIIKQPVWDNHGNVNGIVGLINNVTEQEILKEKLKAASIIDGLTGLYNRKEIQRRIQSEFDHAEKDRKFSVIMLDIDNFKQVNDRYGHQEGDNVIIALADILNRQNVPYTKNFSVGRWGGEEFMMLLPDTEITAASFIAELIRQCFENTTFPKARTQTVSVGVSQAKETDTLDSLCMRVDDALYKAKKTGKNKVVTK